MYRNKGNPPIIQWKENQTKSFVGGVLSIKQHREVNRGWESRRGKCHTRHCKGMLQTKTQNKTSRTLECIRRLVVFIEASVNIVSRT